MTRLTMVSNRLPIRIEPDGSTVRTMGGLASALEGAELDIEQNWVGWPGCTTESLRNPEKTRQELRRSGICPVFLSAAELDGFYEGYSNSTLWPLLHYMSERAKFSKDWWNAYRSVNEKFAEVILEATSEGDMVWVHDYHLFLVPSLLRGHAKGLRVGFFLHTPFCSSELFRILPERHELLHGLLGADIIGFHTYSYLRHFRSSLLRLMGREVEMDTVWHEGREVHLGVYPIGHNRKGFLAEMAREDFPEILDGHRRELKGKRLVLSVERLDYTKGLPEKLAAIRRFLERNPQNRRDVVFLVIAVPSRQGVPEYDILTEEVQREVGGINGTFSDVGHTPIQFMHRGLPIVDLAALYVLAEVCLVTPLRDGMNLVAKEFLDCQAERTDGRPGVLILSEFAGAAPELSRAIQVNPHDIDQVADAMDRALEMEDSERRERIEAMQPRLRLQHSGVWARRFLDDLRAVSAREQRASVLQMRPLARTLAARWRAGESLGLFLDYDGTLRPFVDIPEHALPDEGLRSLLRDLAATERVSVALVSGRPPEFLQTHLGGLGVTLVAEHGYRWASANGEWKLFNPHVDTEWKASIRHHLEEASLLTPGTHVEEKQSALVWHYREADPEFGEWRARSLLDELTDLAANLPVIVHHGQKIVEVSSLQVNKGMAVDSLIRIWECTVALAAGDDQTDETMFSLEPRGVDFYRVKIGKGPTRADHLTDITGIRTFLEELRARMGD
jgi:trehalose 6-phosphate synthase/phosphatase